jgi:SOS-response transcriptional repressor LexA
MDSGTGGQAGDGRTEGGTLAEVARARRVRLGLSLQQVADRVGCAKSYLSAVETGQKGPPSEEVVGRLEEALSLPAGRLLALARWERTPGEVRRDMARLVARQRALDRLGELLKSEGLDGAYRSGELRRLIEGSGGAGDAGGVGGVMAEAVAGVLPREVPLINRVSAGYPADFTDLAYPARVADEYVRCPDVADADAFAARVVGDSMEPDYREGDIVVFSPAREIASGNDCFVRLEPDHETTFKRVYFERDERGREMIRIQPVNPRYPPRTVLRERVAGLYRAVHLMRPVG